MPTLLSASSSPFQTPAKSSPTFSGLIRKRAAQQTKDPETDEATALPQVGMHNGLLEKEPRLWKMEHGLPTQDDLKLHDPRQCYNWKPHGAKYLSPTRLFAYLIRPRRSYKEMSGVELVGRQFVEECFHPNYRARKKALAWFMFGISVLSFDASADPAQQGFLDAIHKLEPDQVVLQGETSSLSKQDLRRQQDGEQVLGPLQSIYVRSDHGNEFILDATRRIDYDDTEGKTEEKSQLVILGSLQSTQPELANKVVDLVVDPDKLLEDDIKGVNFNYEEDANPKTTHVYLVERKHQTDEYRQFMAKDFWDRTSFFISDQWANLMWAGTGVLAFISFITTLRSDFAENVTFAEVELADRKRARKAAKLEAKKAKKA